MRQQEVKEALQDAMDDAARDTTLDQMYCEKQEGVMCLQHSINNIVGQPLFKKADFFNNDDRENGYKKEQLDELLKDNAEYTHASDTYNRSRTVSYMRTPRDDKDKQVLTEQELEHVLRRRDFLGLIVGKPRHWVAIKRVTVGSETVYVQLDSVGPTRKRVATDANSLHNYINAEGNGFTPTVDVVYAWSGYEYLEHELREHAALDVLATYGHDFEENHKNTRAKINFEFIILGVDKDALKREIGGLSNTADKQGIEVYIVHLQKLYNDRGENSNDDVKAKLKRLVSVAAQAVPESPTPTPVITPVVTLPSWEDVQPNAATTSMSDAFADWMSRTEAMSRSEDSEGEEGEEEEETWESMQEAIKEALAQGWAAWRRAQGAAPASGDPDDTSLNFMALPEAPAAALPSPLRFMDHADAASYVAEGAPPSPPRVMIR